MSILLPLHVPSITPRLPILNRLELLTKKVELLALPFYKKFQAQVQLWLRIQNLWHKYTCVQCFKTWNYWHYKIFGAKRRKIFEFLADQKTIFYVQNLELLELHFWKIVKLTLPSFPFSFLFVFDVSRLGTIGTTFIWEHLENIKAFFSIPNLELLALQFWFS